MTARRRYDPDHCTACGDFLPCGESWVPTETCWRSECRNGCYYPDVCSEKPAICPLCGKPAHDYRCGVTP